MSENLQEPIPPREEIKGLHRFRIGAGLGILAGIVTLGLPALLIWLAAYNPGGFFTFGSTLLRYTNWLVIAGAILFILSLMMYRWGFSVLRKRDYRFVAASALCWVGSIGFLLVIVVASYLLGSSDSVTTCIHGQPTQALSCLNSLSPLGAFTAALGFWLGVLGSVGVVLGLTIAGTRFSSGLILLGAVFYALLLVVLILPFASMLTHVPGVEYVLIIAPFLSVLAPASTLVGAHRSEPVMPSA